MGNIFGVNPVLFIGAIVFIVLSVGAWALYEIGKERGEKAQVKNVDLIDLEEYEAMLISLRDGRPPESKNIPYPKPMQRPYDPNNITAAQKNKLDDNLAVAMEIWRRYSEQGKTQ